VTEVIDKLYLFWKTCQVPHTYLDGIDDAHSLGLCDYAIYLPEFIKWYDYATYLSRLNGRL